MTRWVVIVIILFSVLACSSVTPSVPPADTTPALTPTPIATLTTVPIPTPTPTPTTVPAPTATLSPIVQSFSGTNRQATELFELRSGLARFDLYHDGSSNFIVELLDEQGKRVAMVGNSIGTGNTSKALSIATPGRYLLSINADGGWTATVTQ